MLQSETHFTIETLSNDKVPDTIEISYLSLCLDPFHPLVTAIAVASGSDWLHERLEYKFRLWVPYAQQFLETDWSAVEDCVSIIYQARKRFPKTIAPMVSLERLAQTRRDAHTREGEKAVTYLRTNFLLLRQPSRNALAAALLAEVPLTNMGSPSEKMCKVVLADYLNEDAAEYWCGQMLKKMQEYSKALRERTEKLNTVLNPLLN